MWNDKRGLTIIEVLAAVGIFVLGGLGVFALIQQITSFSQEGADRLTASLLAQEGVEIVKNIRDTNFLKIHKGDSGADWMDGLCDGICHADYASAQLSTSQPIPYLSIDGDGFYQYLSGTETRFKRDIATQLLPSGDLGVTVTVYWVEKGQTKEVIVEARLYNWL
ncbi:hypothetical protein KKI17_01980 [Patescibacteria group bacterium]|nr:hypothetical protein [Patescibacteria group bacterium]